MHALLVTDKLCAGERKKKCRKVKLFGNKLPFASMHRAIRLGLLNFGLLQVFFQGGDRRGGGASERKAFAKKIELLVNCRLDSLIDHNSVAIFPFSLN